MITQWSVLSLLRQLTDIGEDEEKVCLGIALSSLERVNSQLKADADMDDVRIAQAAAGLAYYALCVRRAATPTAYRASRRAISPSKRARTARLNSRRPCATLLSPSSRLF